ncbi:hypothetical protein [Pelosinus sp. IPA-1]|uniref:hypothetical protein n=1 Tax=Pelosinus sp. IPA-1 TaxID=3029569 RepID=UPI0024361E67|nr:hypothetical protein [Pelosinus sp. IPA-1]GMA98210.1 hypothetical protein PIPA1_10100 [Pelosinus sp. IPA-1]
MNKRQRDDQVISKKAIYIIGFTLLIIFTGFIFYNTKDLTIEGAVKKEALMNEFSLLQPLPDAIESKIYSHNKVMQAGVSAYYRSNKSYSEIHSYYVAEATKKGWTFISEDTVGDWGKDVGGKTINFRKGDYTLSIQYAGEKADYGWDLAVGLGWRLP